MPPSPHDHSEMLAHHDVNDETVQTGRSRKRRKAPMVYDKSGLTKQQRRDTRMQQRSLYETLETATAPDHLDSISEQNNAIFRTSVKFSREAVLDAENVFKIAQKYEQYAESLVQVPRFDCGKLIQMFKTKCSAQGKFNWNSLAKETGICFNALPDRVTFLCGPLDADTVVKKKKERKEARRYKEDNIEAVKPKQVEEGEQEGDPNKLSASEKTIKQIEKSLKKRVNQNIAVDKGSDIAGAKFLCNPQSFTQTVENMFHFSFLIKKGEAKICIRDGGGLGASKGGLYVSAAKPAPEGDDHADNKQAVLAFTMQDWRTLCEGLTEGDLPHRAS